MTTDLVYDDATTSVDSDGLTLKHYYFPTGRSKRIALEDIQTVTVREASWMARYRLWGSTNFRNWFPLDTARPKKSQVVEIDVGKRIRPTFTPDDPERLASLLRR